MMWKAEAIERLRNYDAMRLSLENLTEEIARLKDEALSLQNAEADQCEDMLLNNLVQHQELEACLRRSRSWLKTVNRALSSLTPEEKLVLHRFYIYPERGNVDRLCGELAVEQSSVYRKRDKALRKFTLALYGKAQ